MAHSALCTGGGICRLAGHHDGCRCRFYTLMNFGCKSHEWAGHKHLSLRALASAQPPL